MEILPRHDTCLQVLLLLRAHIYEQQLPLRYFRAAHFRAVHSHVQKQRVK